MIVLFKKHMDTRDWPRLQKAEGILPYIRTDLEQLTGEDDESDGNISAKTEIHSLGKKNGHQVRDVPTRVEVNDLLIENRQRILTTGEYFSGSASSVWEK